MEGLVEGGSLGARSLRARFRREVCGCEKVKSQNSRGNQPSRSVLPDNQGCKWSNGFWRREKEPSKQAELSENAEWEMRSGADATARSI